MTPTMCRALAVARGLRFWATLNGSLCYGSYAPPLPGDVTPGLCQLPCPGELRASCLVAARLGPRKHVCADHDSRLPNRGRCQIFTSVWHRTAEAIPESPLCPPAPNTQLHAGDVRLKCGGPSSMSVYELPVAVRESVGCVSPRNSTTLQLSHVMTNTSMTLELCRAEALNQGEFNAYAMNVRTLVH